MGKVEIGVTFEENMTNMKYSNAIQAPLLPQDNEIMMQHSDSSFHSFSFFGLLMFSDFFFIFFSKNEES